MFDWDIAAYVSRTHSVILAGGLCVDNVRQAIHTVSPWAVDVASGIEHDARSKNHDKIADFVAACRNKS